MSVFLYEKKGRIVYLTLNRPECLNALSQELIGELARSWGSSTMWFPTSN